MVSDIVRADAELENSIRPSSAPEDLRTHHFAAGNALPCIGTGRADAEL